MSKDSSIKLSNAGGTSFCSTLFHPLRIWIVQRDLHGSVKFRATQRTPVLCCRVIWHVGTVWVVAIAACVTDYLHHFCWCPLRHDWVWVGTVWFPGRATRQQCSKIVLLASALFQLGSLGVGGVAVFDVEEIDRYVNVRLEGCLVFWCKEGSWHAGSGVDVTATIVCGVFPVKEEVVGGVVGGFQEQGGGDSLCCVGASKYQSKGDDPMQVEVESWHGSGRSQRVPFDTQCVLRFTRFSTGSGSALQEGAVMLWQNHNFSQQRPPPHLN